MKLFRYAKDGGPESTVRGFWLIEAKSLFSIALLRFSNGSREQFHSHAFDSINWILKGSLREQQLNVFSGKQTEILHKPGVKPVMTWRNTFHRVLSEGTSWVFSIRGPWSSTWEEYDPSTKEFSTLEHGRKVVETRS